MKFSKVDKFLSDLEAGQELYTQKYVDEREQEIERQKEVINGMIENEEKYLLEINKLKSIIKEVREYIIQYGNLYCLKHEQFKNYHQYKVILEILDKENK